MGCRAPRLASAALVATTPTAQARTRRSSSTRASTAERSVAATATAIAATVSAVAIPVAVSAVAAVSVVVAVLPEGRLRGGEENCAASSHLASGLYGEHSSGLLLLAGLPVHLDVQSKLV